MIVNDAFRFLIPLVTATVVALFLGWTPAAIVFLLLAAFVAFFFRNPNRRIPDDPRAIVSPADGRVVRVDRVGNATKMSIFLSLFNVHVNRSPIGGRIEAIEYNKGSFKAAYRDVASVENERNLMMVANGDLKIVFTQIAGVVARRIVCWKRVGDVVQKGELVGLIRFGSRVDILFPSTTEVTVRVGDRVRGGSTIVARIK
jgi:phosphatidylserine decarboxylase